MTNPNITDLNELVAVAELFIEKYHNARKKLESFYSSASPKRGRKVLSDIEKARILTKRKNALNNENYRRKII